MKQTFLISMASGLLLLISVVGCDKNKEDDEGENQSKESEESQNSTGNESQGDDSEDESSSGSDEGDESSGQETGDTAEVIPDEFKGKTNPYDVDDTDEVAEGEELYGINCAGCHGRNGEGGIGPNVNNTKAAEWADDFYLWKISDGVGTVMPAQKDKLSVDEIWKIVVFVRDLQN